MAPPTDKTAQCEPVPLAQPSAPPSGRETYNLNFSEQSAGRKPAAAGSDSLLPPAPESATGSGDPHAASSYPVLYLAAVADNGGEATPFYEITELPMETIIDESVPGEPIAYGYEIDIEEDVPAPCLPGQQQPDAAGGSTTQHISEQCQPTNEPRRRLAPAGTANEEAS